mgnify:FL=1
MVTIYDFIRPEHDGYHYDPVQGRLFKIEEVEITGVDDCDGEVRARRRGFLGVGRLCTHFIYFMMTGKWIAEGNLIDHSNGNSLDNCWENLREATREQNTHNRGTVGRWKHNDLGLELGV